MATTTTIHRGSTKRLKKNRTVEVLSDSDTDDQFISEGVTRRCGLKLDGERHFFAGSNLNVTADSISLKKVRPTWMGDGDRWLSAISKSLEPPNRLTINGKPFWGMGAHLGFISLPTGLRPHVTDRAVPKWNVWNEKLPHYFFGVMRPMLADDGYVAVLHSGEFNHMRQIFTAIEQKNKFKHLQQYTILLGSPMWKADADIQVRLIGKYFIDVFECFWPATSPAKRICYHWFFGLRRSAI